MFNCFVLIMQVSFEDKKKELFEMVLLKYHDFYILLKLSTYYSVIR